MTAAKSLNFERMKRDTPPSRTAPNDEPIDGGPPPSAVDEFLSERAGYWTSVMTEVGPPVRVDLPALLEQLRRPPRGPTLKA
jgi:hypothetical protein